MIGDINMLDKILLFTIPIYSMDKEKFDLKWKKFFEVQGYDKNPNFPQLKSYFAPKTLWKYNQIIAYIEIYKSGNDIIFEIYRASQKVSNYKILKTGYSYYPAVGNHFYVAAKDTNETIKEKILEMLEDIKNSCIHAPNAYIELEAFNLQIKYMDIKGMFKK